MTSGASSHQRGEIGLPSGKRRGRKNSISTTGRTHSQFSSHLMKSSAGSDRSTYVPNAAYPRKNSYIAVSRPMADATHAIRVPGRGARSKDPANGEGGREG